jgi:hypothetical protein
MSGGVVLCTLAVLSGRDGGHGRGRESVAVEELVDRAVGALVEVLHLMEGEG